MYEELINGLKEGIEKRDFSIQGKNFEEGRIKNQEYFDLYLKIEDQEKRLMKVSIYRGREPYYQPWVEMFSIKDLIIFGRDKFHFFDSEVEDELLDLLTSDMKEGCRIFIEYQHDKTTMKQLSSGIPAPCSRLGYKLFDRGFTWFKDWYFSEGFHEGNQKLQAEKPIDQEHRENHLNNIKNQITEFLSKQEEEKEDIEDKVIERAENILRHIES